MPLSNHALPNVLDYYFGDTSPTVPATYYIGLVIQLGALSSALTAGTAYTSLPCAATGGGVIAAYSGANHDNILLGTTATTSQVCQASASWAATATSITVGSFVANYSYPAGTPFIRCDAYATAQEPSGNAYARVATTNNTTNFPNSTETSGPYTGWLKQNGTTITFPQATGSWGTVAGLLVGDNATPGSGNLFAFCVINGAQAIATNNIPTFLANNVSFVAI